MHIYFILGKLIILSITQLISHSKQWVNIELGRTKKELVHIPSSTISVMQHRYWGFYKKMTKKHTHTPNTANTKTEHHSQVDGILALHLQGPRFISQSRDRLPPVGSSVVLFTSSIQMSKRPSNQGTTISFHTVPNSVFNDQPNTCCCKIWITECNLT
jgi:hypothetical protein